jgi:hypothetical protein
MLIAGLLLLLQVLDSKTDRCNIERRHINPGFDLPDKPIIFNAGSANEALLALSSERNLIEVHGDTTVQLASSNTYSYAKVKMPLAQYVSSFKEQAFMSPDDRSKSNETFYLFGENYSGIWKEMEIAYEYPHCHGCNVAGVTTLGLGGAGSGVSFHRHGPGFSEVIHGKKRWWLYPPGAEPKAGFSFNLSMASWLESEYESEITPCGETIGGSVIAEDVNGREQNSFEDVCEESQLLECTIGRGEVLYFPSDWYHATLNKESYNFFVSYFLDTQLIANSAQDLS